jgi:hypothetical protein
VRKGFVHVDVEAKKTGGPAAGSFAPYTVHLPLFQIKYGRELSVVQLPSQPRQARTRGAFFDWRAWVMKWRA